MSDPTPTDPIAEAQADLDRFDALPADGGQREWRPVQANSLRVALAALYEARDNASAAEELAREADAERAQEHTARVAAEGERDAIRQALGAVTSDAAIIDSAPAGKLWRDFADGMASLAELTAMVNVKEYTATAKSGARMVITVRRETGRTPLELRTEAIRDRDEARAELAANIWADREIRRVYGVELGIGDADDSPPCWEDFAQTIRELRARVAELEQHVGSIHKATAAGMEHERGLIVAYANQRRFAPFADDDSFSAIRELMGEIEQRKHHEEK